jgi:hypothetical protein
MGAKQVLAILLFMTFVPPAAHAESGRIDAAKSIRGEMSKWQIVADAKQASYSLISPIYPLEYDEGCVMFRQTLPRMEGKVSFARMDLYKLYFASAAGSACLKVDPNRFFMFEEGTEPYGALDFIRRANAGPNEARDKIERADLGRLSSCFSPEARASVDVVYAKSQPAQESAELVYSIVMKCNALSAAERIFASGEGDGEIVWEIRASDPVDVSGP